MRRRLLVDGAGWADVLEAAYSDVRADPAWVKRLTTACAAVFGGDRDVELVALRHAPDCSSFEALFMHGASAKEFGEDQGRFLPTLGPSGVRSLYYPPGLVATQLEISESLPRDARELMARFRKRHGVLDAVGLLVHPLPGVAAALYAGYPKKMALDRAERRRLTQIALHVEAAMRLRLRPTSLLAVITTDGRVMHRERAVREPAALTAQVKRIERARTASRRADPEALDLWSALVGGRVSVVERVEGAPRLYYVLDNAPASQSFRAFSRGEIEVLTQAARGLSAKGIAYALGIAASTVSMRLASATSKTGLATRTELVRIAAILSRDPRAGFPDVPLTGAERDVLELLSLGLTNAEIARMRNRSARTIANQVARLLQKTGSPTRRALVTRSR